MRIVYYNLQNVYFVLQAKTLEMKLKSLEEEVQCKTYTKEACNKLEKVRRRMLDKMDAVRSEV